MLLFAPVKQQEKNCNILLLNGSGISNAQLTEIPIQPIQKCYTILHINEKCTIQSWTRSKSAELSSQ